MKKLFLLVLIAAGFTSCSVEETPEKQIFEGLDLVASNSLDCGGLVTYPFGSYDVGKIEAIVWQDPITFEKYLKVDIISATGHNLVQSRVEVANEVADFPTVGGGNLPPGHMAENGPDEGAYLFPLILFEGECEIYISAWAVFTAGGSEAEKFAGNLYFVDDKEQLGKYFAYCLPDCDTDTELHCETAYMMGNRTLNSIYGKPNNWGWVLDYDVSVLGTEETIPLYAARGQNDPKKGYLVGYVTIIYNLDGSVSTQLDLLDTNHYLNGDYHVFVGERLPSKRPVPGQFTNTGDQNLDGKFKIIVHADVCWEE
ncbi:hypothetical protein ACXYMT_08515 [Salinimicrobium sp. CAU 1759]